MSPSEPLSSDTALRIASLAKQISVAEGLDQEIQAELRGHIEDKVRGYVSGTVKVSEADAMLLAKAHFGDAAVIKGMFQGVHAKAHGVSLAQRLLVVFVLSVWIRTITSVVDILWEIVGTYSRAFAASDSKPVNTPYLLDFCFDLFLISMSILLFWKVLSYWRKHLDRGEVLWFEKWSPMTLVVIALGSVICYAAVLDLFLNILTSIPHVTASGSSKNSFVGMVVASTIFRAAKFLAEVLLWLWWCDRAPRTVRTLIIAGIAWLITNLLLLIISLCAGSIVLAIVRSNWRFVAHDLYRFGGSIVLSDFIFDVLLVITACGIYTFVMRRRSMLVVD